MNLGTPYISRIEFLVPSNGVHVFINGIFFALHAVVVYFMLSTMGEPYRNVVSELAEEAARSGSVLLLETLESTEEVPIPGEFAPNPITAIAMIVSISFHLLFYLVQRWSVAFRVYLQFKKVPKPGSFAVVYPAAFRGSPAIVPLTINRDKMEYSSYLFTFQRRKFTVNETGLCELLSFPIEEKISDFVKSHAAGVTTSAELARRESVYGLNRVDIPVPPFWKLFLEQVLSPIPIFQLFCSALWMMDEYWKYTLFTLLSIFGFEVSTTVQRKKSLETLRSMSGKSVVPVEVFRREVWFSLTSDHLVPGDRVRFTDTSVVPCDCLIVAGGSAVVNEASLTGESVPQMKDAIDTDRVEVLDIVNRDKVHVLFSGTRLLRLDADVEMIVLRTGSESSQGELLRMVEFSQQNMGSDKRDTMYLLLLLLVFALLAASYVVWERVTGSGSENLQKMNSHKLMLRVIMIITSVVPPELPMQMSLSVNTALMALHKIGVFCTEPFRVPMAGTVSRCFFDKTGTLTSDQLECKEIISRSEIMCPIVIASCHALIEVDGKIVGDPIELSALEKIGWKYSKNEASDGKRVVKILHRFHFSSALQRMSCVVQLNSSLYAVVKGSPERVLAQLAPNSDSQFPQWYTKTYESLAAKGMRVLALAYRDLSSAHATRELAESNLKFAGFASFACETRSDSATVINALSGSAAIPCVMITGDAPLTAIHVAKETGISRLPVLILKKMEENFVWEEISSAETKRMFAFIPGNVAKLATEYDLAVSGTNLATDDCIWESCASQVKIFARMSPQQKERVVALVGAQGGKTLMCGDGGNDVGALKQADVGVALLAGFGALNVQTGQTAALFDDPEEALEQENRLIGMKEKQLASRMAAEFAVKKKELMAKQQEWMGEELARNGNAYWAAIKTVTAKLREELAKEGKEIQAKYGAQNVWQKKKMAEPTGSAPVVGIGDASVAAPFTSRAPSIRAVIQIVRQGRCTLLVAVQMMQIMMLESLVSAYTFAAITMEGGRSTELQLIGSSIFVMIASVAFTYAKPAKKLSNVIPLKSVFHPSIFFSVFAQVAIHLAVLVFAMSWAKAEMGPEALSNLYSFEREREKKLTQIMANKDSPETSWLEAFTGGADMLAMFKSVPYEPNLLNTVMFLVKTCQQVSVLVVNYKGSPWMQGALENKALFLSMFICALGIAICSSGYIPALNNMLELMVLPHELRTKLLALLALSTVGTLVVDRLIVLVFSPDIFFASTWEPLRSTRLSDFLPILKTCGYILAGLTVAPLVLGNPIGLIGGVYAFRQYKKWRADQDLLELQKYEQAKLA